MMLMSLAKEKEEKKLAGQSAMIFICSTRKTKPFLSPHVASLNLARFASCIYKEIVFASKFMMQETIFSPFFISRASFSLLLAC
jgi:hypothetical protein